MINDNDNDNDKMIMIGICFSYYWGSFKIQIPGYQVMVGYWMFLTALFSTLR